MADKIDPDVLNLANNLLRDVSATPGRLAFAMADLRGDDPRPLRVNVFFTPVAEWAALKDEYITDARALAEDVRQGIWDAVGEDLGPYFKGERADERQQEVFQLLLSLLFLHGDAVERAEVTEGIDQTIERFDAARVLVFMRSSGDRWGYSWLIGSPPTILH